MGPSACLGSDCGSACYWSRPSRRSAPVARLSPASRRRCRPSKAVTYSRNHTLRYVHLVFQWDCLCTIYTGVHHFLKSGTNCTCFVLLSSGRHTIYLYYLSRYMLCFFAMRLGLHYCNNSCGHEYPPQHIPYPSYPSYLSYPLLTTYAPWSAYTRH